MLSALAVTVACHRWACGGFEMACAISDHRVHASSGRAAWCGVLWWEIELALHDLACWPWWVIAHYYYVSILYVIIVYFDECKKKFSRILNFQNERLTHLLPGILNEAVAGVPVYGFSALAELKCIWWIEKPRFFQGCVPYLSGWLAYVRPSLLAKKKETGM